MKNIVNQFEKGATRRGLALALAVCMVFTLSPPITAAEASDKDSGEPVVIFGFAELPENIREQSVPIGTSSVELTLPDTLEATVYAVLEDTEPMLPSKPVPPTEPVAPSQPQDSGKVDESTDDTKPTEETYNPTEETTESREEDISKPVEEPEEPMEETPAPKTEVIEESIVPMSASPSDAENNEPEPTQPEPTPPSNDVTTPAAITVEGITWESNPIYDSETAGTYTFTAVLPEGYTVEDGVAMPTITVSVGQAEQSAVEKVIAMIDALLELADLTADPPGNIDPEYAAWLAKTQQTLTDIREAKAAYDALTDEEKAQIDEVRTAKLLELAELAEQMTLMMQMAIGDTTTVTFDRNTKVTSLDDLAQKLGRDAGNVTVNGTTLQLQKNITINLPATPTGQNTDTVFHMSGFTFTMDLNGKTLTTAEYANKQFSYVFKLLTGMNMTLIDTGVNGILTTEGHTSSPVGTFEDSSFTMKSGSLRGGPNYNALYIESGTVEISGGTLSGEIQGSAFRTFPPTTVTHETALSITGGTFIGVNAVAASMSFGTNKISGEPVFKVEGDGTGTGNILHGVQVTGGNITIDGNPTVIGGNSAGATGGSGIFVNDKNVILTINGGSFTGGKSTNSTLPAVNYSKGLFLASGTVIINGGTFTAGTYGDNIPCYSIYKNAAPVSALLPVDDGSGNPYVFKDSSDDDLYGGGKFPTVSDIDVTPVSPVHVGPKNDPTILDLVVDGCTLEPEYDKNTAAYTATVANSVDSVGITATLSDMKSSMTIQNGDSGTPMALTNNTRYEQSLNVGVNKIMIKVDAKNNKGETTATMTYTLTITREVPPGYAITITPNKDGTTWTGSGKTYKLKQGATEITDLSAVVNGTYDIYEGTTDTGVDVTVNGATASATVDYYTVTFYNGATAYTTPAPQVVLKTNGRVTKPADPTKTGYTFAGWKTANGGATAFDFGNTQVTAVGTKIYASWTAVAATAPTITNHPADTTVMVGSVSGNLSVAASAALGHTLSYQWYSNTTNTNSGGSLISAATNASFAIPTTLTMGKYYYYCVVTATHDNGKKATTASNAATVTARLGVTVTFNPNGGSTVNPFNGFAGDKVTRPANPTKTGYTFAGWFKETGLTNAWDFDNHTLTASITLYAKWTPRTDTAYIVKHYQQNLADNSYPTTPTDTENKTGTTGANITPPVKSYTGFSAPSTQTVTIAADGSTVVSYHYTRNSYALTWNLDGGTASGGTTAGSVKFGATLTSPSVTKQGYDFASWNPAVPATMPAAAATYTAQWTAKIDTGYKVEYYQQNVIGNGYTETDSENKTGTTNTSVSVTPDNGKYTGFTYNADAAGTKLSGTIAADGSLVLAVYYDRNTYAVSFDSKSGSAVGDITGVRHGATIDKPADPTRTGYDFAGWYKEANCTNAWTFVTDTVAAATTLYAKWTDNQAPTITAVTQTVPPSGWFNVNTDITLTYGDNEGVTALAVSVDGANYTPITLQSTYTVSTEGEHTYKFKATDAAGLSAETDAVTVKLDKTAPTGVSISYEAVNTNGFAGIMRAITFDNFFKEKVKVTVTVTDATSGAAGGKLDYKTVATTTDETEPTGDWQTATLDRDGKFSFEVNPDFRGLVWAKGYDLAGNASGWTFKNLTTEQTPPTLALNGNTPSEDWQKANVTFTVTASDSSGIDSVTVSDTLSSSTPAVTNNGGGTYTITVSANGTHGITVTATDNAGNTASLPEYTIRIDKTAPTIAEGNVITESADGKLTFTVTPSDGTDASGMTGGNAKVEYSTDNSIWNTAIANGDGSYTFELTSASGDIYIKTTDAVGNAGTAYHKTGVVLESTPPTITFSNASLTAAEGTWFTTTQPFTVTADDKPAGVTVSSGLASLTVDVLHYEGGGYVKDTSLSKVYTGLTGTSKTSDSISPTDGRWKVIATAIDQNGNTTTEIRFVRLDTGAPTLSGGTAANITDKTADLQFVTTEAGDWYYLLDPASVPAKGEVAASDKTGAATSGQNSIPLDSLTSGSKHTVYVVVKDEAGNISEVLKIEFATKQTAPTADKLEIGYVDEAYTLLDGVELFSDPECTTEITGGSITGSIGDTVYIRYPEKTEGSTTVPPSTATPVEIPSRPSAPAAPTIHYADETATMAADLVYSIEQSGTSAPAYSEASSAAAVSIAAQIAANGSTTNTIYLRKPASKTEKRFAGEGISKVIPARPATPTPGKADETYPNAGNGKITGLATGTAYEISADGGTTWKNAAVTGTEIQMLTTGSYIVRVKATDSAFKSEPSSTVTIGTTPAQPETTPDAEIGFKDETIGGLTPGGKYEITVGDNTKEVTADENGKIAIDTDWIGKTVDIVKPGNGTTTIDSPAQQLPVPARPGAPVLGKTDETYPNATDGTITDVDSNKEYKKAGETAWRPVTGTKVTGLSPGEYEVRVKATDSTFASVPTAVTIGTTAPQKAVTPTAAFEAANNTLSNVAADMQYSLDGGATWKNIGAVTSIIVTDPINIISDILVKRLGNGTTTIDSDHQRIELTKAATPVVNKTDETAKDAKDGTLTGVSTTMEYQKAGDSTWTAITGDTVTSLAPETYFVRVKGAGTVLASDPAGPFVIKAFGVVNVPVTGLAVTPARKTIKAGDTAQLTASVTPADATNKAVKWTSDNPDVATVDATGLVTAIATGNAKITATTVDGGKTAFCTVTVPETGAIDGTVTDKDGPVKDVAVTVHWGGTTGKLVGGPVITDFDGKFSFTELPHGTYSLVAKRTQNGKDQTITKMIVVTGTVANGDIFMPEGERNTVVEVKGNDTPSVAVEGLDDLFKPKNQVTEDNKGVTAEDTQKVTAGGSVEIKLTAETKKNAEVASDAEKIQNAVGDKKEIGLLLDLSVLKTITAANGKAETPVKLTELSALMEIVIPIPAELYGKEGLAVLRVHNGVAELLSTGGPGEHYTVDGETIILHVQKFSTYALVINKTGETPMPDPDPTPPSGGDDDGGGNSGGSSYDEYTITATAHDGGEISPSGRVKVDKYSGRTFTITPDEGWVLEKVLIDGKREVTLTNGKYTFKSVTEPYTIDAYFVKSDVLVIPDAGDKTIPETGGTDGTAPGTTAGQGDKNVGGGTISDTEKGTENTGEETADKPLKDDTGKNTPGEDTPAEPQPNHTDWAKLADSTDSTERPFIVLSALFALAGPAFAVLTAAKKRSRKRKIISAAAAIGAVVVFLLTTGWSGFALASWWSILAGILAIVAGGSLMVKDKA